MKKLGFVLGISAALVSGAVMAHSAGDVIVRAGGALVVPNVDNSNPAWKNLDVNSNAQLGLTATYMFTDNVGVELLAATPFSHEITLGNTLVGKTKHLPPSLYAQYYFLDKDSPVRPYIGAGVNYTTFFDEKEVLAGVTDLKLKDSWGLMTNMGVDINITDNFFINASMYYAKIKTKATFKVAGTEHENKVTLDPTIFFLGVGYRF
ncbi:MULTISPECIES: OmpW family outer membrane protein [Pasteurellaceae]|uniref:Outer membrane protein W n=1 Tax=Pasteurella bettyae CCUG 2042 TaxID=1095749 RepID=I3D7R1_9PAST|nr:MULTISPECIES: OmpW family outer membrane protein [Pasteurellaceae]EIJ67754.1 outer membrane protein W [Pasteurella bettyae CCUG 2042]SUB22098.1 outer membrane protein OmpW [Pasteurella bettyae]